MINVSNNNKRNILKGKGIVIFISVYSLRQQALSWRSSTRTSGNTEPRAAGKTLGQRRALCLVATRSSSRDKSGAKGGHHINATVCVAQFQMVAACERISEVHVVVSLQKNRLIFENNEPNSKIQNSWPKTRAETRAAGITLIKPCGDLVILLKNR
jgi:hypothetical protein